MKLFFPVVKPEISGPLEHEMEKQTDIQYVKEQLKRLDIENPIIAKFIREFSKTTKDRLGVIFGSLLVYRMLESQAEANQMFQEL